MSEDAVSLYPNPSTDGRFTIVLPEISKDAMVRIYDSQGRMLYQKLSLGNNRIEIDARLKAGFYIVRINLKESGVVKKLIVQ
ncbi:T9SS type A sorting domain-containing protein [Chitinophaga terrae (ex Kim and Jung 2007)]|nr:T9SS type A sorting domain-containing protein [Chitinophaga terrae (ex Kim and Jung 2007)]